MKGHGIFMGDGETREVVRGAEELVPRPSADQIGPLVLRGLFHTLLGHVSHYAISIGTTAVLARLLAPRDYGLLAMVTTLTAFFQFVSDFGLSWVTIRTPDLSKIELRSLFWINTLLGLILWLMTASAGPLARAFYGEPALVAAAFVVGCSFLLAGASVQPLAVLRRTMRFGTLVAIENCAALAGSLTAIALALAGAGWYALAAQSLVRQGVVAALGLACWGERLGRPVNLRCARRFATFSAFMGLYGTLVYFDNQLDRVIIGRWCGIRDLGYYSRATFLATTCHAMVAAVLNRVLTPAFSVWASTAEGAGRRFQKAVLSIALFSLPYGVGVAVVAKEVVELLYGPNWEPVISMLTWLAVGASVQALLMPAGALYIAAGRSGLLAAVTAGSAALNAACYYVASRRGVHAVAFTGGVLALCRAPLLLWIAHRVVRLPLLSTLRNLLRPAGASLVMVLCVWCIDRFLLDGLGVAGVRLFVKVLAGMVSYAAALALAVRVWDSRRAEEQLGWFYAAVHGWLRAK